MILNSSGHDGKDRHMRNLLVIGTLATWPRDEDGYW